MLRKLQLLVLFLCVSGSAAALIWKINDFRQKKPTIPPTKTATVIRPAKPLVPFKLTDNHGHDFTQQSLKGHWSIMFFGYTDCPDICPATLSIMKTLYHRYPRHELAPARFIFTSINPTKDGTKKLTRFLAQFNDNFIGLSGSQRDTLRLQQALNIYAKPNQDDNQKIDHSSHLVLINPQGNLAAIFSPPFNVADMAEDLVTIIKN